MIIQLKLDSRNYYQASLNFFENINLSFEDRLKDENIFLSLIGFRIS